MISTVNTPSHFQIWVFRLFGIWEICNFCKWAFWTKIKTHFDENFFHNIFFLHTYIGTKVHRYLHSYHLNFSTKLFVKMFLMKSRYVFTLFLFETSIQKQASLDKKVSLTELSTYICQEGKFDWQRMREKNDFLVR